MEDLLVAIDTLAAWAFFEQLDCSADGMRVCVSVSDLNENFCVQDGLPSSFGDLMRRSLPAEMQQTADGFHGSYTNMEFSGMSRGQKLLQ